MFLYKTSTSCPIVWVKRIQMLQPLTLVNQCCYLSSKDDVFFYKRIKWNFLRFLCECVITGASVRSMSVPSPGPGLDFLSNTSDSYSNRLVYSLTFSSIVLWNVTCSISIRNQINTFIFMSASKVTTFQVKKETIF